MCVSLNKPVLALTAHNNEDTLFLKVRLLANEIMAQKKENSATWASNWWTHTLVMELELKTRQAVLQEGGRDKSAKLSNCPHEDISKSHSVAP